MFIRINDALRSVMFLLGTLLLCTNVPTEAQQQSAPTANSETSASAANDPTSPIPQVQIKSGYHTSYDGEQGQGNSFLVRPVLPLPAKGFIPTSISRIQLPLESVPNGRTGLGDVEISTVFYPKSWAVRRAKLKWGIGPSIVGPTSTSRYTGQGQWQVGPSAVILSSGIKNLLLGMIETNSITVSGVRSHPSANDLSLQPFIVETLPKKWYLRFDPLWDFNMKEHGTATLPLNLGLGHVQKLLNQEFSAYVQPEFLARCPPYLGNEPPRFTLRFAVTLLYPKKKE